MLKHYVLLSLKVLLRRKFFTFVSIFGISFTLMVLMVVTAIADHRLGPGKPETAQSRMLGVRYATMTGPSNRSGGNPGFRLFTYAQNLPGVELLSVFSSPNGAVTLYVNGERMTRAFKYTDAAFWQILDFEFLEGAPYVAADVAQARPVAVINRSTRARLFGDRDAVGQVIEAEDINYRVVGVVEDVPILRFEPYSDIWVPYTTQRSEAYRTGLMGRFWLLALARDRAAFAGIRDEFNARLSRAEFDDPRRFNRIVAPFETKFESFARNSPFADSESTEPQTWRLVLFLAIAALLFVALPTVNLINLNVSRILERASEIGVRKAFGAPARTLVGQFVVENVVLTVVGGLAGLALSGAVLRAINQSGVLPYSQLAVNVRVFGYGMLIAVVFGLLSGVYPAWRMARLHPVSALRGGSAR